MMVTIVSAALTNFQISAALANILGGGVALVVVA